MGGGIAVRDQDDDREPLNRAPCRLYCDAASHRRGTNTGEFDVKRFSIPTADHVRMEWYTFVALVLLIAIGAMVSIALWLERPPPTTADKRRLNPRRGAMDAAG